VPGSWWLDEQQTCDLLLLLLLLLSPQPRTLAYQAALLQNPSLLQGATVLDVGCGTSILSLFAARGGAQRVVGLDGSERIAGFARKVRVYRGGGRGGGSCSIWSSNQ
jgi:protein arginine N-methyltransferase 3